jgi:hypothetical protein
MKAGHPRADFDAPTPTSVNTHTRSYGCGIPVKMGVGSRHTHGFANTLRVSTMGHEIPWENKLCYIL